MKKNITKQIILGSLVTLGFFSAAKAQSAYDDQSYNDQYSYNQPQQNQQQYQQPAQAPVVNDQQSFYYYPNANVYYDNSCGRYIYNNGGSWLSVNVLPSNIYLGNSPRYMVYHKGPQVWLDNPIHIRNYYRPAYRQPEVAFNNYRHDDFKREAVRRDDFRRNDFRQNVRFNYGRRDGR